MMMNKQDRGTFQIDSLAFVVRRSRASFFLMSALFPWCYTFCMACSYSLVDITYAPGPVRMIPRACEVYAHSGVGKLEDKVMRLFFVPIRGQSPGYEFEWRISASDGEGATFPSA